MPRGVKKVPQVMQMEALECGAACLAMILAYYGRWEPLEKVREKCGVSRDGSKASNILKAARSYGLSAEGAHGDTEALRTEAPFPCIIFWNFNHFVVLDGFKGNYAYLNDPARGEVRVTMKEFEESFTGVVLLFEKTDAFEEGGKKPSTVRYARERLAGMGTAITFVMLTAAIKKHVADSLAKLNCTRVVIAHRLSTVRECDRILVVAGGAIAEEGTYDELIAKDGIFADLVARQRLDDEV